MKNLMMALLLGCAMTLVGCGGGSSPGDSVKELAQAMEAGDAEKLKELVPALEENLGDSKIETIAKQMAKEMKEEGGLESVTIDEEKIDGDKATVKATLKTVKGEAKPETFELEKNKDGKWVILMDDGDKPGGMPTPDIDFSEEPDLDVDIDSE